MTIVFENQQLLPASWKQEPQSTNVRAFNPALLRDGAGWLMAYRIVAEPELKRRIAICRLDADFRVIERSQIALSDWVRFSAQDEDETAPQATTWFADPRLYRLRGRLFIYWNSGWHEPRNYQFLQELDPATLLPVGSPREMLLTNGRQKLEKNWTLFEGDGLFAVYSVNPHRILAFSLDGNGPVEFADFGPPIANPGGHAQLHGGLRGGAPPQLSDGRFYSFCHSIENGADGYNYVASVYRFEAREPFIPTDMPRAALPIAIASDARRNLPRLNPAVDAVIYPSGAAKRGNEWVLSLGIDDEHCAIAILEDAKVRETLEPIV